jgi:LPXTG-site transpeptidase (sortase) family protein
MQLKRSSRRTLLTIILVGLSFCLGFIFNSVLRIGSPSDSIPLTANIIDLYRQGKVDSGLPLPIRLRIPEINVSATVEQVGLTSDWSMGVPKGPSDAGWFDLGPHPGEVGSAVIAGHYGWKNGIPAVFDNLHNLVKGDKIYVEDETGTTTIFVVRELRIYGQNDDASAVFTSSDGKAHLNLITCEGVWSTRTKSYANRLVAFADKE